MQSFSENLDNNTFVNDEFGNICEKEFSIAEIIDTINPVRPTIVILQHQF